MTKYRIKPETPDVWYVQYKWFMFWRYKTIEESYYGEYHTRRISYPSREAAEEAVMNFRDRECDLLRKINKNKRINAANKEFRRNNPAYVFPREHYEE